MLISKDLVEVVEKNRNKLQVTLNSKCDRIQYYA